jgi:hypothetical protein
MNSIQRSRTAILPGLRSLPRLALAIVAFLTLATVAPAQLVTESRQLLSDSDQKLTVEVKSWLGLGNLAPGCFEGLVPLEFTVVNGGTSEAVIPVRCGAGYGMLVTAPGPRSSLPPEAPFARRCMSAKGHLARLPAPVTMLRVRS